MVGRGDGNGLLGIVVVCAGIAVGVGVGVAEKMKGGMAVGIRGGADVGRAVGAGVAMLRGVGAGVMVAAGIGVEVAPYIGREGIAVLVGVPLVTGVRCGVGAGVRDGAEVGVGVDMSCRASVTAAKASARPPDTVSPARSGSGSALRRMIDLMSRSFSAGFTESIRAAMPATCGDAIEVPLARMYWPLRVVLRISSPGAPMSTEFGPQFEKNVRVSCGVRAATEMILSAPSEAG
jgi:hypothetical protein